MMDSLIERRSDPMLPNSLSDADLVSSFSDFFLGKITHIRRELDFDLRPYVFSVDFDAHPKMITTVVLYFEHISLHKLLKNTQRNKENLLFSGPNKCIKNRVHLHICCSFLRKDDR